VWRKPESPDAHRALPLVEGRFAGYSLITVGHRRQHLDVEGTGPCLQQGIDDGLSPKGARSDIRGEVERNEQDAHARGLRVRATQVPKCNGMSSSTGLYLAKEAGALEMWLSCDMFKA